MNNIIPIKKGSYVPDIQIKGRTLVNLLGRRGNAIYKNWFSESTDHVWGTLTYDGDAFVVEKTDGDRVVNMHTLNVDNLIQVGKCYIALADVKPTEVSDSKKAVTISGATIGQKSKANSQVGKFDTVYVAWKAVSNTYFEIVGLGKMYVKNIRLYEIDESILQKINVDPEYSWDNLIKKYPYVDDIKCVVNPYLESKENYVNNDTFLIGTYYLSDTSQDWHTVLPLENGVYVCNNCPIKLEKGIYYLNGEFGEDSIDLYCHFGNSPEEAVVNTFSQGVIEIQEDCTLVVVITDFKNQTTERAKVILEKLLNKEYKVTLVKGSEPKKYQDCNNSRIIFETKLYDGETISRRNDGTYVKNSLWEEVDVINNEYYLIGQGDNPGFKAIHMADITSLTRVDARCISYDGRVLIQHDGSNYKNTEGFHFSLRSNGIYDLYLLVPNSLTGWGDSYLPTEEEIRAFFLGWRMFTANTAGELYNGTGTKAWAKLWCSVDSYPEAWATGQGVKVVSGSGTNVLPRTINEQGYTPYKLIYKKETATIQEVSTHGSLLITEDSKINASSGMILNEKIANGYLHTAASQIHTNVLLSDGTGKFDNKLDKVLKIQTGYGRNVQFMNMYLGSHLHAPALGKCYVAISDMSLYNIPLYADYLVYQPDTISDYEYTLTKVNSVKDDASRHRQELTKCNNSIAGVDNKVDRISAIIADYTKPNLLINGDFQVWQRGATFTNIEGAKYTADRWQVYKSASGTAIPNAVKTDKGIKVYASEIATGLLYLAQTIECPKDLWGRKITVSYKGDQVYSNIHFNSDVVSGSNGASLGQGLHTSNNKTKQFTTVVPIGTKAISVLLLVDTAVQTSFEIEWVKLEVGDFATPLSPRQYAEEFDLCQRYYQHVGIAVYGGSYVVGQRVGMSVPIQHRMRTIGSIENLKVDAVNVDSTNYKIVVSVDGIHVESLTTAVDSRCRINFEMYLDAEIY